MNSMKAAYIWLVITLITVAIPLSSDAQLLKNLVNNMKQSIANKPAGQPATGAGKTDSASKAKAAYDSTYLTQLMAKASKPKPSISPADSAAAIKSFMTGTGGSGLIYQYHIVYTFKGKNNKDSVVSDTLSTVITDGHNVHSDLGMLGTRMQVIGHAGMPRYSVLLYPDTKNFVFNIIDTAAINSGGTTTYQVIKVGNETVLGYNCIHSKMTTTTAGQRSGITQDIWTCAAVPGYTDLKKMTLNQNVTPKMMQALEQAGCGGAFVKMDMQAKGFSMDMQLIAAERKTFPASMFQIPAGYTQSNPLSIFARGMPQR
jgi:hypothetical protein